jgi:hypothetical protein
MLWARAGTAYNQVELRNRRTAPVYHLDETIDTSE